MKTTNSVNRNTSAWLRMLYCLIAVFCFVGCSKEANLLRTFSSLEKKALRYGTVSAGAARVTKYDCNDLIESRQRLREALCRMRCKWLRDPNDTPHGYLVNYVVEYINLMLGFKTSQENSSLEDPSTDFATLSEGFKRIISSQMPRPSEIELIGFYMAAQKFVESELDELDLGKPDDPNFRRLVVSLDLTAWVRGEAKAALVYIDLYPHEADSWCHKAGIMMHEFSKIYKEDAKYRKKWRETLEELRGYDPNSIGGLDPPPITKEGLDACITSCHVWLEKNKLRPRIIQVERMSQGEYLIYGEGSYSGSEFQVGGAHPIGLSGSLKAGTTRKDEELMAKVRPLSLAFVAGERRAGWLFMPGKTTEGKMAPTERRLRMVVDVPKDLEKLGIHVHKIFLDEELCILPSASFSKQIENLDLAWSILNDSEVFFEKYNATVPRHYRLIKTRIRDLLHQGWSEETVVDIPIGIKGAQ